MDENSGRTSPKKRSLGVERLVNLYHTWTSIEALIGIAAGFFCIVLPALAMVLIATFINLLANLFSLSFSVTLLCMATFLAFFVVALAGVLGGMMGYRSTHTKAGVFYGALAGWLVLTVLMGVYHLVIPH